MKVQSLQETLGALVGDHVRPATESDLVAGVQPQFVVEPGKEEEIAKVLAFADREGLKVLVRGGGTQLNTGLPPTDGDVLLSMARLNTVAGYDLPKLFTGALGTLGVIVAATFRLYPLRAASRTVVLTAPAPAPLCDLAVRVIASTLDPTALDVMSASVAGVGCVMAGRFETEPES